MKNSGLAVLCAIPVFGTLAVPFAGAYGQARDYPTRVNPTITQRLGLPDAVRINKEARVVAIGGLVSCHRLYARSGEVWDDQIIGGTPRMAGIRLVSNRLASTQLAAAYRQLFPD